MKNILITGGSRGIGAAATGVFAQKGYRVFLNYYHSLDKAEEIASKTGAIPVYADVSNPSDVEKMIERIHREYGLVDVLINNAAVAQQKLFSDITIEEWDTMFNINIRAQFLITKAVLPDMIHKKRGKIINLSSVWGITGASCEVHYSASKAAVIGFTKALAKELGPSNIQVNCVAPGVVDTQMNAHLTEEELEAVREEIPLERFAKPEELAEVIFFLASDKADYLTGQVISPNGGMVI
jgi:3-oxoacyl-[acyl-carrier protein] reductase